MSLQLSERHKSDLRYLSVTAISGGTLIILETREAIAQESPHHIIYHLMDLAGTKACESAYDICTTAITCIPK